MRQIFLHREIVRIQLAVYSHSGAAVDVADKLQTSFLREVIITPRLKWKEKGREERRKLTRSERQVLLNSANSLTQN